MARPKGHRQRRIVAWAAIGMLVLHAVVPGLAMAAGTAPPGPGIPVCTAAGIVWLPLGAAGKKPTLPRRCDFCLSQAMVVALVTPPTLVLPAALPSTVAPVAPTARPIARPGHCRPPVRAPPLPL